MRAALTRLAGVKTQSSWSMYHLTARRCAASAGSPTCFRTWIMCGICAHAGSKGMRIVVKWRRWTACGRNASRDGLGSYPRVIVGSKVDEPLAAVSPPPT